jgi:hypothetical protein
MKLIDGLLDYSTKWTLPNVYLFTGNAVIKNNGAIVMGRGAAKQVRDSYKDIDKAFGAIIERDPTVSLAWVSLPNDQHLGWFKVKDHWRENAKVEHIKGSAETLSRIATRRPNIVFHMNYPGIGNGRLDKELVEPIIQNLPDNVRIYK